MAQTGKLKQEALREMMRRQKVRANPMMVKILVTKKLMALPPILALPMCLTLLMDLITLSNQTKSQKSREGNSSGDHNSMVVKSIQDILSSLRLFIR